MQAHSTSSALAVPDGEFPLTWEDFHRIAALVHGQAGIVLNEAKANLVYSRLAKRLRAIGLQSFRDYCELVQTDSGAEERGALISALTTNVTRFFREEHHFRYLEEKVWPAIARDAIRGHRVRIWSAGCSSGEEPYSIGLSLVHAVKDAGQRDLLILASDLDPEMVARGTAGRYPIARLEDIPTAYRDGIVREGREGGSFSFLPSVLNLIRFRELNLIGDWPVHGPFDVVFCRNVMIYFDEETQNKIWKRFARLMPPGAILCIGHSERIDTAMHPFDLVGQTIYRRKA
ncbi:MAG: CheR family methyltransferase [Rhizomicrobium sp.]